MNAGEMARHSVKNHHVNGLDYLCLHRSDKLTVKLYFLDPAKMAKERGDFLVAPHTHRYSFESYVLHGRLGHIRLWERRVEGSDGQYECFAYDPDTRTRKFTHACDFGHSVEYYGIAGQESYWNSTSDIHTLLVPDKFVLLGLVQFSDICSSSEVYLRKGSDMKYPESRPLTDSEAEELRWQALSYLK
jgi:hypothetical protein